MTSSGGTALARLPTSYLWELRTAWATGRRVSLSLDERSAMDRAEGHISTVAATGAFIRIGNTHIPLDVILAVHLPSRLGDSTVRGDQPFHAPGRRIVPQDEELFDVA